METLPVEIEQKLEALPIIPFDINQEFQDLIFSELFTDIFNFYKQNYLPDILKTKPELYQRVSLYLTLTGQDSAFVEQTNDILYRRPVPTIQEFLSNNYYHGRLAGTMYPYWKEQLYEIFDENSPVRKVIFSGCIGSGKSTIARKAVVYMLYKILCLRYPRAVYNIDADSTIANFILSVTLKQVYDTNLLPFIKLLEGMPCFQKVMSVKSFDNFNLNDPMCPIPFQVEKSTDTIFFPDNIILTAGSQISHTVGYNIVNSFCDEINEKGVNYAMEFLNSIDSRFSSRFEGSDFVFQSIVSSARTTNSPVGEYIRRLPKNDPKLKILNPMLWEVKPDPNFVGDGTTFPVLVGNGSIPSKIITDPGELDAIAANKYIEPTGCTLIHVPTVYKSKFELQLDQSIQDIAGMATNDNNSVFRDTSSLEDLSLNPEMYLEVNIKDNVNILNLLEKYNIFSKNLNDKWQFRRAPKAERYIHCDLAGGGDNGQCDAAICILHKEWKLNEITNEKEIIYVVDLLLFINAKNKVDIHAIQTFLINLVVEKNISIFKLSADQWQSLMFLQQLEASGCFKNVEKLSVDTKLEPYTNAALLIEKGFVKLGKCPKLKKELEALILDKGKVTRTTELKDGADAIVGAIWNAQSNYFDLGEYNYDITIQKIKHDYSKFIDTSLEEICDFN